MQHAQYLDEEELESDEELEDEDEAEEALFLVLGGILESVAMQPANFFALPFYMLSVGPEKVIDIIDLRNQVDLVSAANVFDESLQFAEQSCTAH